MKRLQEAKDYRQLSLAGLEFKPANEQAPGIAVKFKSSKTELTIVNTVLHCAAGMGFGAVQACEWWPELFFLANKLRPVGDVARGQGFAKIGGMVDKVMERKMATCRVDLLELEFMQVAGLAVTGGAVAKKPRKKKSSKAPAVEQVDAGEISVDGDSKDAEEAGAALTERPEKSPNDSLLGSPASDTRSSQPAEDRDGVDFECTLCMENVRTHAFIPCGHFSICASCAETCKQQSPLQCFQCGQDAELYRIYFS